MSTDSYFHYFPTIKINGNTQTDISPKTALIRKIFKTNMLADYTMKERETAQSLAQDFYGNPEYDYVIHLANDIVDPFLEYPLTQKELKAYTTDKYSPANIYAAHHYEKDGVYYDTDPGSATVVSYIEVEEKKNDLKRDIRILRPEFLSVILSQFVDLMNG